MCTVTFIARHAGYALGMNRDEKCARAEGLPPRVTHVDGRSILAPSESSGGTWVGVNDAGTTLALINWYAVKAAVEVRPVSRGEVVRRALASDCPAAVAAVISGLPLVRVNPFRLIGVFPNTKVVVECRWNLRRLERREHPWRTQTWISSGFDEPGAVRTRGKVFREAGRQRSAGSIDWLRRLHRTHRPEAGPYSTCMHREDAATVSYTEVIVSRREARMRYAPGAPCCVALRPALRLRLI